LNEEFECSLTKDIVNHTIADKINPKAFELEPAVYLPTYAKYAQAMHRPSPKKLHVNLLAGHKKILHICDLHIPFQNDEAIATALRSNATADIVIASELMDLSSQSFWDNIGPAPIEVEIEETLKFLELLSENFETVFIVRANHDLRVQRRVLQGLPQDLQMLMDEFNLIDLKAKHRIVARFITCVLIFRANTQLRCF